MPDYDETLATVGAFEPNWEGWRSHRGTPHMLRPWSTQVRMAIMEAVAMCDQLEWDKDAILEQATALEHHPDLSDGVMSSTDIYRTIMVWMVTMEITSHEAAMEWLTGDGDRDPIPPSGAGDQAGD